MPPMDDAGDAAKGNVDGDRDTCQRGHDARLTLGSHDFFVIFCDFFEVLLVENAPDGVDDDDDIADDVMDDVGDAAKGNVSDGRDSCQPGCDARMTLRSRSKSNPPREKVLYLAGIRGI
ncbi:hypothetical protein FISHEDRAFT_71028 [Fistulina hepatica ATCC 64428]|uniref:Uncharacterized protein n=1 Tax=Fistulina hepatica ATCC 64428 TaxID=1128425 RepID=A0A0D7AI31_9AGAR|nr:hypothetical protein FISHEDRAFT_71028 [Fistulina hepatica ATCC 64428]